MWIAIVVLIANIFELLSDFFEMFARFFGTLARDVYTVKRQHLDNNVRDSGEEYEQARRAVV